MSTDDPRLPARSEMLTAMNSRDSSYEGVFYTAVKTTGIFCRPTCTARKPLPKNVDFYRTVDEALAAGFRPCKRCRPLQPPAQVPRWVASLLAAVEADPMRRWTDEDVLARGLDPVRTRRWFKQHFGMTFHTYLRSRRLGLALGSLQLGDSIDGVAYDHGYESVSGFREAFRKAFGTTPGQGDELTPLHFDRLATPLGPMIAMAEERGIVLLEFVDRPALVDELAELRRLGYRPLPGSHSHLEQLAEELTAYFAGNLQQFTVPVHMLGTPFEMAVWAALRDLSYGETCSYGEIAEQLGRPRASRAVGRANGRNWISIVVPCHRVLGADGSLTGYGGGKARKEYLLRLERESVGKVGQLPLLQVAS